MAAMTIQELDDPMTDDYDVTTHRARAKAELGQIVQQVRLALTEQGEQGIDIPLFFLVPSASAVLVFGTVTDPPDAEWARVGEVVASIVAQSCGLRGTRRREVVCAATHDQESHDAIA
jgi:hypothetical protein